MTAFVAFWAGMLAGAILGVFTTAVLAVAHDSEERREKEYQELMRQRKEKE